MRPFVRFVVRTPVASGLFLTLVVALGVYAAWHMPVDLLPNLEVPVVNVVSHYPGATAEDIELLVSRPIEAELGTIVGVKRVASTSVQGISVVTVNFSWRTSVTEARQAVQAKLSRVRELLPPIVRPRLESIGTTLQEVAGYIVYGGADLVTLRNAVQYDLVSRLRSIDGVSMVQVLGGDQRAITVTLRPETLAQTGLSVGAISTQLQKNNMNVVAGYAARGSREYFVRGDARLRTVEDVRALPVTAANGQTILLGTVADVAAGRTPRHYQVHGDCVPAVALLVRKQPGASTIRVVRELEATVARLHGLLPPTARIRKFYDQSEIIREARDTIVHDLLLGAALAVLVLYFFLGSIRPTLIVAVTIPVTLLATAGVMHGLGLGWNIVTMTAVTLAIGMIVDDAIVVAENIYRHRSAGRSEMDASIDGTLEIAAADASGTITTVAAFLPLVMVTGLAGLFLKPFGLTISAALLVSLVLSLTLVPMLFSRSHAGWSGQAFLGDRLLHVLDRLRQKITGFAFHHKMLTVGIAGLFLCLAGLSAFLGKVRVLPPIDEGAILIEYVLPPGTSLRESGRIGDSLDRIALADPDVACVYRRTGSPEQGYQIEGVNAGEIVMKLKPKSVRRRSVARIMASLKKTYDQMDGVVFLYHQPTQEKIDESFSGLPAVFGVTVYGTDMQILTDLAGQVEAILARDPAVANIVNNTKVKSPELRVRVKYPKLALLDVSSAEIMATLQASQIGVEATRIIRQKGEIVVMVKLDTPAARRLEEIRHVPITSNHGELVPLDRVADVRIAYCAPSITRLNGQRQITLLAEVDGNIPAVATRLRRAFAPMKLPAGYSIDITGQYEVLLETAWEMLFVLVAAVVLIYFIMVLQFHSWRQPLVILLTIPFCLVGALAALFMTHQGLDVSVAMGAITLVGIAVNNAIVLLDYANKRVASGGGIEPALLSAASVRLRPILLTSLTTIFALLPTAVGTAVGSRLFQPFAITVIGGLLSGIPTTLVLVPTLVSATQRGSDGG